MSAEVEALNLRVARLETTNANLVEALNGLQGQMSALLNDPMVMQSIASSAAGQVIKHLQDVGLDTIDPPVTAEATAERSGPLAIRVDILNSNFDAAGAFAVFAPNPEHGDELEELTAIRRSHYEAIVAALKAYKFGKKKKGVSVWVSLSAINRPGSILLGETALKATQDKQLEEAGA